MKPKRQTKYNTVMYLQTIYNDDAILILHVYGMRYEEVEEGNECIANIIALSSVHHIKFQPNSSANLPTDHDQQ
jgi:hypothetical protein